MDNNKVPRSPKYQKSKLSESRLGRSTKQSNEAGLSSDSYGDRSELPGDNANSGTAYSLSYWLIAKSVSLFLATSLFLIAACFLSARVLGFDSVRRCPFLMDDFAFVGFDFVFELPSEVTLVMLVLSLSTGSAAMTSSRSNTAVKNFGSPRSCDNCFLTSAAPSRSV